MTNKDSYNLVLHNDKTIKQLFERFYIIRKDDEGLTDQDRVIIEKYMCELNDGVGEKTYIIKQGRKPKKLTEEQQKEIKESTLTQRELGRIYNVSASTINKVKNNKY